MDKSNIEKELKLLISGKLKKIKEKTGSSLEKMAAEIGIDYVSLYNIYKGVHLPRIVTLFQISQAYDLPLEFWFKEAEKLAGRRKNARRRKQGTALRLFDQLDARNQKVMLKIMRHSLKKKQNYGLVRIFFDAL
jgi:transcriptional regulator with XRE-family HTH domain